MRKFLCCFRLDHCIGATYLLNSMKLIWCIVCLVDLDLSRRLFMHGSLIVNDGDVISLSIGIIFLIFVKLIIVYAIDKLVIFQLRRFRYLFYLMAIFYCAFTLLYVVIGATFLIADSWKATILFLIWFVLSTYILICYYSLYSLNTQSERSRIGFRSLYPSRNFSIESHPLKPKGHLSHDTNIKPIDYDEYMDMTN